MSGMNTSPRIAIIVADINYVGGAEIMAANLYNSLLKEGYDIDFVSLFSFHTDFFKHIPVRHIGWTCSHSNFKRMIDKSKFEKRMPAVCSGYDIVIGNNVFNYFVSPSKNVSYKQVEVHHSSFDDGLILYKGFKKTKKKITLHNRNKGYKILDKLVVLSRKSELIFNDIGVNTFYIPNYVTNTSPSSLHRKLDKVAKLLFLSRIDQGKGIPELLSVWDRLTDKYPDVHLYIYGKGGLMPYLMDYINTKANDRIHYQGFTTEPLQVMREHDVLLFPSWSEGFPMILIEAMSVGLPCVAFDCNTGPSEIINDSQDGYVVELGDTEAMVDRISQLITTPDLRNKMSEKAMKNIERYSEKRIIPLWKELIHSLLTKNE